MNMVAAEALKHALVEAIDRVLEDHPNETPIVGGGTALLMADAAMSVLLAVSDLYDYLEDGGFLRDE